VEQFTSTMTAEQALGWMKQAGLVTGGETPRLRSAGELLLSMLQIVQHAAEAPVEDEGLPVPQKGDSFRLHSGKQIGRIIDVSPETGNMVVVYPNCKAIKVTPAEGTVIPQVRKPA
jgi:hypothetical protein